jgi:hydroxyacylglutathione hydrolase
MIKYLIRVLLKEYVMIVRKLEVGPMATNCFIVGSESTKEGLIIDPADEASVILENVNDLGLDVKYVVLTHGHLDHIGALKEVGEKTGAEVAVHSADAYLLQDHTLGQMFGLFYPIPSPADRLLEDGDDVDIGDLHFKVMHTPGHTPGGISLFGHGVVFAGDTLFRFSIGRTDFPGGDYGQLINSIKSKLMVLPDDTVVYTGHGPDTTIGAERHGNPFLTGKFSF